MRRLALPLGSLLLTACLHPDDGNPRSDADAQILGAWEFAYRSDSVRLDLEVAFPDSQHLRRIHSVQRRIGEEWKIEQALDTAWEIRFSDTLPLFTQTRGGQEFATFARRWGDSLALVSVDAVNRAAVLTWSESNDGDFRGDIRGKWRTEEVCGSHSCAVLEYDFGRDSLIIGMGQNRMSAEPIRYRHDFYYELQRPEDVQATCYRVTDGKLWMIAAKSLDDWGDSWVLTRKAE